MVTTSLAAVQVSQHQAVLFVFCVVHGLSGVSVYTRSLMAMQVSAPGSTFLGTLASAAWEEQRVRLNEGGHFVNLSKFRVWGGPNKLSGVRPLPVLCPARALPCPALPCPALPCPALP